MGPRRGQKILWTMRFDHNCLTTNDLHPYANLYSYAYPTISDEKWFYGLVALTFAKACETLNINKQTFSCQHKSHMTKAMRHGTVAYCFDNNLELGENGYLIGLHRCQSYKVMQRQVSEQSVHALTVSFTVRVRIRVRVRFRVRNRGRIRVGGPGNVLAVRGDWLDLQHEASPNL
jgi:hypothetical protein